MTQKTLAVMMLLLASMLSVGTHVSAQTETEPLQAQIGLNTGNITEGNEIWYQLEAGIGQYKFNLTGANNTDFDLFLYDSSLITLDSSREAEYPENIDHFSYQNTSFFVKILAFEGNGEYNLTISYKGVGMIETGVEHGKFAEAYEIHYYQLNTTEGFYNITLDEDYSGSATMTLYGGNMTEIDSISSYYGGEILFYAESNNTYFVKVVAGSAIGGYDIYFTNVALDTIGPGTYSGELSTYSSVEYYIKMTNGQYYFTLTSGENVDLDMYLSSFDGDYTYTSAESTNNPEIMTYRNYDEQIGLLEIEAYSGEGEFTLEITEILNETVPEDYTIINEQIGIDLYEVTGMTGNTLELGLNMVGELFYMAVLDTPLDIHIINALITEAESEFNPHNLVDSYTNYKGVYGTHRLNYTSEIETLYIAVYSLNMLIGEYTDMNHGYQINSSQELSAIEMSTNYEDYYPHKKTGQLSDNGDEYWDDGEFIIYKGVSLSSSETFDMILAADDPEYEIIFLIFDGTTEEDINEALQAFYDYYNYGYELPDGIYAVSITYTGLGFLSFNPSEDITFNIAVFFDLPYYSTSASFSIFMSHPASGDVLSNAASANYMILWGVFAILPVLYIYRKNISY